MAARAEKKPSEASNTDLFGWLNALYNKEQPTGTPPTYMMHRFMASNPDLAQFARVLQQQVREPALVFRTWQGLLPYERRGAPRFQYVAAKKPPEEDELVSRMKEVLSERRSTVEMMVSIIQLAGRTADLYKEFGIKQPGTKEKEVKREAAPPKKVGLLARRG